MLVHALRKAKSFCFSMMTCHAIADFYQRTLQRTQRRLHLSWCLGES
jgi:hypothetical protein